MMLVEEPHRCRGIGRALMVHALDRLDSAGVRTVRLDATPVGRPLYESLGFVAEATLFRYQGTPAVLDPVPSRLESTWSEDVARLDQEITDTDRGASSGPSPRGEPGVAPDCPFW